MGKIIRAIVVAVKGMPIESVQAYIEGESGLDIPDKPTKTTPEVNIWNIENPKVKRPSKGK